MTLDENATALLAAINEVCCGNGFKIVEERELSRALPKEEIARTLSLLEERRLIELRYAEEGTYCVRTMPAGRSYAERSAREEKERRALQRGVFRSALSGALFGGLLASAIGLLLAVFLV